MPVITLPDGSQRTFDNPVTVAEVAASIGSGLAKAALAGKVGGKLVDTSFSIANDSKLEIVTDKHPDALEIIRHSTAHLLAQAVQRAESPHQVHRVNAHNAMIRQQRRQRVQRDAIVRVVERGHNAHAVRDVEIRVAGRHRLTLKGEWLGHGQLDDVERLARGRPEGF